MFAKRILHCTKSIIFGQNWGNLARSLSALMIAYGRNQRGATSIEYAMIATGIGVALILVMTTIGDELVIMFTGLDNQMTAAQKSR